MKSSSDIAVEAMSVVESSAWTRIVDCKLEISVRMDGALQIFSVCVGVGYGMAGLIFV